MAEEEWRSNARKDWQIEWRRIERVAVESRGVREDQPSFSRMGSTVQRDAAPLSSGVIPCCPATRSDYDTPCTTIYAVILRQCRGRYFVE